MWSDRPKWYVLEDGNYVPCDEATWRAFRSNEENYVIAKTYIEPDLVVSTQFVGVRDYPDLKPTWFLIITVTEAGCIKQYADFHGEAIAKHNAEVQRLISVVEHNDWSAHS